MADNAQKSWFLTNLNRFAERKASEAINLTGKALPCSIVSISGSIVTVKFEVQSPTFTLPQVTIPIAFPEYIRVPFQVGDKGVCITADAVLGGINGLGSGVASLTVPANLSALVFVPVGNANWNAPIDPDMLELYGKSGVVLHAFNGNATVTIGTDQVTININGKVLTVTETAIVWDGDLKVKGNITAGFGTGDAVTVQHHLHGGVSTGSGNTSQPTAGT